MGREVGDILFNVYLYGVLRAYSQLLLYLFSHSQIIVKWTLMWVLCGYYVGTVWVLCGYYVGIMWVLCPRLVNLSHIMVRSRFGDVENRVYRMCHLYNLYIECLVEKGAMCLLNVKPHRTCLP